MSSQENIEKQNQSSEEFLITEENYLLSGVHIGTQQKCADMKEFIYKIRSDGLYVLDIKQTDMRIRVAGKFLSRFPRDKILIVSARPYGQKPVKMFSKTLGTLCIAGRFLPGTLTNPNLEEYIEPDVIILTDPTADFQAHTEARNVGIPIIGLCDVNNETKFIDLIIPTNNKGRRALATIYWLLTREILKQSNEIQSYNEFKLTVQDFEATL